MRTQGINLSRADSVAASFIVALFLCAAAARAQVTTANVTLGINTAQTQAAPIASDYSGLSFEMQSVIYDDVNNGWYLSGSNTAMIALAKTLGIKSVRVGGDSAETGNIATAADEDAVIDYCNAIGANLIWDLEIAGTLYNPTAHALTAQSMQNYLTSKGYNLSMVFEISNEPDLQSGMTVSKYDSDFSAYRSAINALFSGAKLCGPNEFGTSYASTFCPAEGPGGQVYFENQHFYYFGSSHTSETVPQQIAAMLASTDEAGYASMINQWVPYGTAQGMIPRYGETNSFYQNGSFGSSNAYAAALWGLSYMYYNAQAGIGGLNFHMGENSNDPAYNALTPCNVATSYTVNPLAYGITAFNIGGHGNMIPVTVGNSSNVNLVAYSVLQADGSLIVTAIDREYGSPSRNAALSISTSGTTYNDAEVMFLTGSNNDPSTLTGETLGGAAITGTGSWAGTYMGMAAPSGGSFAVTLPIAQAAIIRLFNANGPAAPSMVTGTGTNSQITLNWTPSSGATSYTVERSGTTGGPYTVVATGVTTNSYVDSGLASGAFYYYVVAASNASGVGPQSAEAAVALAVAPPSTPTGLAATPGDSVVSLTWNVSAGATNYILESSTNSNGPFSALTSTSGTSYLNTGLTDGTTYYYTITAVDAAGSSSPSTAVGATPFVNPSVGWIDTVTSSAQSWNSNANWSSGYPNAAQAVALINSAIAANQTINLNQAITVGEMSIGSSGGAGSFTLAANGGSLTFNNAPAPGSLQQLASSKGDTISAGLTIDGNLNVSNASANPLTFTGAITGSNNLSVNGGNVVFGGATTYSGTTTASQGTLTLANSSALQDGILCPAGGAVSFGSLTACTVGGLAGSGNLALVNAASTPVALTIGNNGVTSSYGGSLTGAGSVTMAGTGIVTLSNANYTGATTVSFGNLYIIGGTFGSPTSAFSVEGDSGSVETASATISGGDLLAGTLAIGPQPNQYSASMAITGSASAAVSTTIIGTTNSTAYELLIDTTGTVSLGAVTDTRDLGPGLDIENGTVTATSLIMVGYPLVIHTVDTNVSGGSLTIGNSSSTGAFELATNSADGDAEYINVTGGTLTYLGTDGLLANLYPTPSSIALTSGTTYLTGITLDYVDSTSLSSTLSVSGGATLYLGSVGLNIGSTPTTDSGASIMLGTGTVGALANWSSAAPITLPGTLTIQAADASGIPHNIALSGALSGAGGFTKTGGGTLTLSASSNYTGATVVSSGTLLITGTVTSGGNVTVQNGATLNLASGTLTTGTITVASGGTLIDDGVINGSVVNNGNIFTNSGGAVTISGNVTNNGSFTITNDSTMNTGGTFTNYGILDIMTGAQTLPTNFINDGTVLNVSLVKVQSFAMTSASNFTISIQTYPNHTYQLQSAPSLSATAWANVTTNVTSQTNGSGVMTFSLTNVTGRSQFFRLGVGP